jgi:hypothetical protein
VTDDEIRDMVTRYITGLYESDNADCLHEMEEFDKIPTDEEFEETYQKAMAFYRQAIVTVTYTPEKKEKESADR